MSYLVVYGQSGKIYRSIDVPDSMDAAQAETLKPGEQIMQAPDWADLDNAYVSNGEVLQRQVLGLPELISVTADGQDEAVITGIPAGVSVTWPDGQTDEVTDGEVRFSVDLPGTYTLRFTAVEY